jgi:hypothetical protein
MKERRMKSLEPFRHIEELNHLKELVDEADRESWIAESSKWRERAELRIQSYPWELYEIPDTTVNWELPGLIISEQLCTSAQVKSAAVP